jgi:hypothetical protein
MQVKIWTKIANRSFENVPEFKYLGRTVTNLNSIQEEIKKRLNCGTACYHSVQNLFLLVCCLKTYKLEIQALNFARGSVWV